MDFPELLVILMVAFIFLGPEKMIEVATRLGEFMRKIRETWDELRYQLYLESVSRKVDQEIGKVEEHYESVYDTLESSDSQEVEKEHGTAGTSQNASDGASERAPKQAD